MSKAMVFTDLHAHTHKNKVQRLGHGVEALRWAFRTAIDRGCDYVFFLGDLFHDTEVIDVRNYFKIFECFNEFMEAGGADVYLLVGNHDMYLRNHWDVNSLKPMSGFPRVTIIDLPTSMTLGGRRIDWLPHTANPVRELENLKRDHGGAGDILFGHVAVNGAKLNPLYGTRADVIVEYDGEMVPVDVGVFSEWGLTVLGHYHAAQRLSDTVEYLGSPYQISFGEAFQKKHVMILDLETLKREYVENDFSPKHYIIKPSDVEHSNYELKGQFVRLEVQDMGAKELIDLKMEIDRSHRPLTIDVKKTDTTEDIREGETLMENAKAVVRNIPQTLEAFIDSSGVSDGLDRKKLLESGMLCLQSRSSVED